MTYDGDAKYPTQRLTPTLWKENARRPPLTPRLQLQELI